MEERIVSGMFPFKREALFEIIVELGFSLLPLLVIGITTLASREATHHFLPSPEWSFASSVLIGLTITRATRAQSRSRNPYPSATFQIFIAASILLLLVPALLLTTLAVVGNTARNFSAAQVICLILSALYFTIVGLVSTIIEQGAHGHH
jgi:arginine exporter protein ArgO